MSWSPTAPAAVRRNPTHGLPQDPPIGETLACSSRAFPGADQARDAPAGSRKGARQGGAALGHSNVVQLLQSSTRTWATLGA